METKLERTRRLKREWYHRNKDAVLAQQNNPEKKAYQKQWYQRNKAKCIDQAINWRINNPQASALINLRQQRKTLDTWHTLKAST